jgi:hypothetical protein
MSIIAIVVVVGVVAVGYAVYQLVKSKKAVTVGNVVTAVKTDAAAVKTDVKKV